MKKFATIIKRGILEKTYFFQLVKMRLKPSQVFSTQLRLYENEGWRIKENP